MKILASIHSEGFKSEIRRYDAADHDGERVIFIGDADIDADGANGQCGSAPAYRQDDKGVEALSNGGMGIRGGRVTGISTWFADIVIVDENGHPKVMPNGTLVSKTSYRYPGIPKESPSAYVDSQTVPYIVVPPIIIRETIGAVLGCKAIATNTQTGKSVDCVVADVGPAFKVGELSIAAARALGIDPSPRTGGTDEAIISYQLFPGVPATINGHTFALQKSDGTYLS